MVFFILLLYVARTNIKYLFYLGILCKPILNIDYLSLGSQYLVDAFTVNQGGTLESIVRTPLQSIYNLGLVVSFGIYFLKNGLFRKLKEDGVLGYLALWLLFGISSFLVNWVPEINFPKKIVDVFSLGCFYSFAAYFLPISEYRKVFLFIILSAIIPLLLSLAGILYYSPDIKSILYREFRIASSFNNKNAFSYYLCIVLYVIIVSIRYNLFSKYNKRFYILTVFILLIMMMNSSIGALLGLLFSSTLVYGRRYPKFSLAIILVLLVLVSQSFYLKAFIETVSFDPAERGETSLQNRLFYWSFILENLPNYWPLGAGLGTIEPHLLDLSGLSTIDAHNDYLRIIAEYGFLGFFAYLLFLGTILKRFFYLKSQVGAWDNLDRAVYEFSGLVLFSFLVWTLSDGVLNSLEFSFLILLAVGGISFLFQRVANLSGETETEPVRKLRDAEAPAN